jgi:hypothetical protein
MKSRDWMDQASCTTHDSEMWFATPKDGALEVAAALAICHQCPVRAACLEDAMATEAANPSSQRHGVAGGLTAGHRTRLANGTTKPPPPCGTEKRYRVHRRLGEDCQECRAAAARAARLRRDREFPRKGSIAPGPATRRMGRLS